jgi:hypothetical protein
MTDGVSLALIFSGMIAFVPNLNGPPQSMTALLLNAYEHQPLLRVPMSTIAAESACPRACHIRCLATDKETFAPYCECPLEAVTVSLSPLAAQSPGAFPDRPEGVLPAPSNAKSIAWLVHLRNLDDHFSKIDQEKLKRFDGSRITFPWTQAATCAFDEEINDRSRTVFMDKFIQEGKVVHEQAVAEMAVFEVAVTSRKVKLEAARAAGNVFTIILACPAQLSCPIVFVNAARSECRTCAECIYGKHFLEYWKLTGRSLGGGAFPRRECGVKRTLDLPRSEPQALGEQQQILCPDYAVVGGFLLEPDHKQEIPSKQCPDELDTDKPGDFTKPTRRALNSTLIDVLTIGDRIICPMAVIQP